MQATSLQEKMNTDNFYSEKEMSEEFYNRLKTMEISRSDLDLKLQQCKISENSDEEDEDHDEGEEEEEEAAAEEFSFVCVEEDEAAIAAEDAFSNGQIKAAFPLFDQSLLFSGGGGLDYVRENLPMRPPVKKVFVETEVSGGGAAASSSPENTDIAGPYCEWSSRKAVEASPESCKKSNSTGFSKIWRLKEITCRSNSDGRDAFVFLNGSHAAAPPPPPQAAVKTTGGKVKKSVKGKAAAVSAHEVYLKSKAKEEERRRSYLPYRPVVGFFTNVNGGLTRNVHPF